MPAKQPDPPSRPPTGIPASDWYAAEGGSPLAPLGPELERRYPAFLRRVARRVGPLRGLLLLGLALRGGGIAVIYREPGVATLLIAAGLLGRRRPPIVLLEFIPRHVSRLGPLYALWRAALLRPALRRAATRIQVLSEPERDRYGAELGLERGRIRCVRWALSSGAATPAAEKRAGVLASGRAWCDWETVFAAARPAGWPLTVVCGERDRERVARLNGDGRARVLVEIPERDHARLLGEAALCAIVVEPGAPSAGQVRLMAATDAGTPAVVSDVPALRSYFEPGVTALTVPPGDPAALRAAIEGVLADPERGRELAAAAAARARRWTMADYHAGVRELVVATVRPGAPDASSAREQE